jgi:hypothetical protein
MENLAYRPIDLTPQFRSELYLAYGPKHSGSALHGRVIAIILGELAGST